MFCNDLARPTDAQSAFDFYHAIRFRLPVDPRDQTQCNAEYAPDLLSIAENFDVFVFDAFGVLNVGTTAIPGATSCIQSLRALGKSVFVLTNGASTPLVDVERKFEGLGFDFSQDEIVSSRHAAEQAIAQTSLSSPTIKLWGLITPGMAYADGISVNAIEVSTIAADYDRVDAFLFLSSMSWDDEKQNLLRDSLKKNPRPILVANPDVVAPHESGFSLEPGYYTHMLMNEIELEVAFHGKPFPSVYEFIRTRVDSTIPSSRIAMLGDTLHTDVLGGATQGWTSVLVSDYGLFRGHKVEKFIEISGITPDWIIPSI